MGRSTNSRCNALLLISLLCVGITLQMLGVSLAFWDLNGSSDLVESSLLEGFAIISTEPVLSPIFRSLYSSDTVSLTYQRSPQHLFFHPPLPIFPAPIAT